MSHTPTYTAPHDILAAVPPTAVMNKRFIVLVSGVAALGGLLFGFDTAIISGTIPYITSYFNLNEYRLGWAVSSILIGCAIGALAAGKLADQYGRRFMLVVCGILFAISGVGAALSFQLPVFVFFRLLGGLGVGAAAMVSPMYIAEIAPAQWRGRLVAFYQLAIVAGILLAYFSNYLLADTGINNWRWMFASQTAPSLLFLLLLALVPESPRWLIKQGKQKPALQILTKISGATTAKREVASIQQSFHQETSLSWRQLFSRYYRPVVFTGILIAVFQQITGINSILYYAPVIFKETGLSSDSSLLQTICIGIVNVLSTLLAIWLVDKVGRRRFLLAGSVAMGLCLLAVGLCFQYQYFDHYLVLVFTLLYVAAFGCTLGAVTWIYLSEIFPNRIRGLALSAATLALWLADFVVTYTFPVMTKHLGTSTTLYSYAFLCGVAFLYLLTHVKETKGQPLEALESLFTTQQKQRT